MVLRVDSSLNRVIISDLSPQTQGQQLLERIQSEAQQHWQQPGSAYEVEVRPFISGRQPMGQHINAAALAEGAQPINTDQAHDQVVITTAGLSPAGNNFEMPVSIQGDSYTAVVRSDGNGVSLSLLSDTGEESYIFAPGTDGVLEQVSGGTFGGEVTH